MKYIILWVTALVLALTFTLSAGKSDKDTKVVPTMDQPKITG
ncbi:hypothetical protein [Sulfurovum mangrovi]|nr:hypothetical protein [Sulfurovum mangrovi]